MFPEILAQGKNVKKYPNQSKASSDTFGYAKSREPIKNWGFPSYLGSGGPNMSKFGPNDQNHKNRSREPNKATFSHGLKSLV